MSQDLFPCDNEYYSDRHKLMLAPWQRVWKEHREHDTTLSVMQQPSTAKISSKQAFAGGQTMWSCKSTFKPHHHPRGSGALTSHRLTEFVQPQILPAPQNKTLVQFQGNRQERLKRDESYSNQSVVLNKLFSKIEGILKHQERWKELYFLCILQKHCLILTNYTWTFPSFNYKILPGS